MFISTYGYQPIFSEGKFHHVLLQKAVDLENNIELFEIGSPLGSENEFDGPIYCLNKDNNYIPFIVRRSSTISWSSIADFNVNERRIINSQVKIPEVNIVLSEIGLNLYLIRGRTSTLSYSNIWGESTSHGYNFPSLSELETAFCEIQEALPVLAFDNYRYATMPKPSIVREISPCPYSASSAPLKHLSSSDSLRTIIHSRDLPLQPWNSVIELLENKNKAFPVRIEEFMAVILEAERNILFRGHSRAHLLLEDMRVISILRSSFDAYYSQFHLCFEIFLLNIYRTALSRETSRYVFESFPSKSAL